MPLLNPSLLVCSSPFLTTKFDVRRRSESVGEDGFKVTSDQIIRRRVGIITAVGDNGQDRGDDAGTGTSTYSVVTNYPLRKQAKGVAPDQVLYRGMELLVTDVADYLDFGKGWVEATCTSDKVADLPIGAR